jgi:uncharacterized protein YjaZ
VKDVTISSPVYVEGFKVGLVRDIIYDYSTTDKVTVEISLEEKMRINKGSYIAIVKSMLSGGELHIHLNKYVTDYLTPGDTLEGHMSDDIMGTVQDKLLPQVVDLIPKIDSILVGLNTIVNHPALNQNVLVADSLLSLSADKYMGIEYPLYKAFFNQPQRNKMQKELVAADYLAGWLMSEFPFTGNEQQLLDRMVYEGKIKQLVLEALPGIKMETLMGYTQQDADWWQKNESVLWKYIVEHKQLNTADRITTARYFEDAHNNFPVIGAPANTGTWLGWQIVKAYQNKSKATPQQLMQVTDPNEILRVSEYKP